MLERIIIEPEQTATASVIWLHGLGADGNDFVNIIPALNLPQDHRIRFIFPHAPVRPITINGGIPMRAWYDFYSLTDIDHQDKEGIHASQKHIQELIDNEITANIASDRILLAGFSQGGAMALFTGLSFQQKLAGIMALSSYIPLHQEIMQHLSPVNRDISILMTHGEHDDVLPIQVGQLTHTLLSNLQYTIEWHQYPMGHEVCEQEVSDISAWLRTRLC